MAWGNPYGMNPYAQMAMQQYQQNMQMQQPQPQAQNNAIIHVPSEEVARRWDVAPNSSVTFIDDSKPYCYTKSMGMSMLEAPVFKRFRLVEEAESLQEVTNVIALINKTEDGCAFDENIIKNKSLNK